MNREARKVRKRRELKAIRASQKHDNGIVRISCVGLAWAPLLLDEQEVSTDSLRRAVALPRFRALTPLAKLQIVGNLRLRLIAAFKAEHELTDDEFGDPVNQTLFAIQYPEARS